VNFIEDVIQKFPFSQEAVVAIDAEGQRKVHHFSHLFARSLGLSGAMLERGVRQGDVVMTMIGHRVEWVISMLACFRMGAIAYPCNPQLTKQDLEERTARVSPALAIGEERYLGLLPDGIPYMDMDDLARVFDEDLDQAMPAQSADLSPDDPALIVFTSGSMGMPKAVVHKQSYLTGQTLQARNWFGARPGELAWCTAAPGWSKSSRNVFIAPWLCDARALLVDERFDPLTRLEIAAREGVNVLCQAPTEYRMIANRIEIPALPALRRMVSAGEAMNADVVEAFRSATGIAIADGYGQTETGHVTGFCLGDDVAGREGSMGRPLPGIETRIEDGVLEVRPETVPTFFSHYIGEEPFTGEWWNTGDLVEEDEDGFLYYLGRSDDLIQSSGYRIGPVEIESVLASHPAVAEVAVVPAPDPERGSVVRAVIVTSEGASREGLVEELQTFCREQTAPYKYPRIIDFVDALPKTATGKVARSKLKKPEA
jgi:acyl-coenzyme A synthetase/AMP-(fatty) acid ligase